MTMFKIGVLATRLCVALTMVTLINVATADIQEDDVILLYYGADPESDAIRVAYEAAHPNVHSIDIGSTSFMVDGELVQFGFRYTTEITDPPLPDPAAADMATNTPGFHANRYYITPEAYEDWIRSPLEQWILDYEATSGNRILAMATTRGLPAAISIDFNISDCVSHKPRRIKGSFESALAAVRFGPAEWSPLTDCTTLLGDEVPPGQPNDYNLEIGTDFSTWVDGNDLCVLPVFVSRLDSEYQDLDKDAWPDVPGGGPPFDFQAVVNGSRAPDVADLIARSQNLIVNKGAVMLIWDAPAEADGSCLAVNGDYDPGMASVLMAMADNGWCVYTDNTEEFLDGIRQRDTMMAECAPGGFTAVPDSVWKPGVEGLYSGTVDVDGTVLTSVPELIHFGKGYNHGFLCGDIGSAVNVGEVADSLYAYEYDVHPAGIGMSIESYHGLSLHMNRWSWTPQGAQLVADCDAHGQALHWIGAGGSFALSFVIGNSPTPDMERVMLNLYEHNLTWAEAAYSIMPEVASIYTPIGDPLAKVTVIDPDLNGDGDVTPDDIPLATPELLPYVNEAIAMDLDCGNFPLPGGPSFSATPSSATPPPCNVRGDVSSGDSVNAGDGVVDFSDLTLTIDRLITCGPAQNDFDANGDGTSDLSDLNTILRNWNLVLADVVNDDCLVNIQDWLFVQDNYDPKNELCPPEPDPCPGDVAQLVNGVIVYCPDGIWDQTDNDAVNRTRLAVISIGGGVGCANIGTVDLSCGSIVHNELRRLFELEQIDCNRNGIFDQIEIEDGTALDVDGDLVIDSCSQCVPADCAPDNGDGTFGNQVFNIDDLLAVINSFGQAGGPCDIEPVHGDGTWGNNIVNIDDLLGVINRFGPCGLCLDE
ncbi:MAG: hypothetical protein AAF432_10190 [Planctomycetota bacterium]